MIYHVPYGEAFTLHGWQLVDRTTGQYKVTPTLATGDFKIEKDGGTAANLTTLPSVAPTGGSSIDISFSATELQCKQATLLMKDVAGAEWNDDCIHIFTVGNASAHEQFNRFSATVALSASSRQEVTGGVWEELRVNHDTVATFGEGVASVQGDVTGNVDGNVEGNVEGNVDGSVGSLATGSITASTFAADAISASALSTAAAQEVADEVLDRNLAGGGSGNSRNVRNALRSIRNRVRNNGGTLEVFEENDSTIAWSATLTTASGNPITEVDP